MGHDFFRNNFQGGLHVFIYFHWGVVVEVLDVRTIETTAGCGDSAIDDELGCGKAGNACCCLPRVVDPIAVNSETHTFFYSFIREKLDVQLAM